MDTLARSQGTGLRHSQEQQLLMPHIFISLPGRETTIRKNGLALCKNAHWMFDQGLWSLDDDYRVIVASQAYDENPGDQKSLISYQGQRILLPNNVAHWPDLKHIAWHRQHKFCVA